SAYNISAALLVEGPLDPVALRRVFDALTERHETLRTTFESAAGRVVQRIAEQGQVSWREEDLSGAEPHDFDGHVRVRVRTEAGAPFDLSAGPLLRVVLLRSTPERHAVILTMHHVVTDGWSVHVLIREISALYEALAANEPSPLPPLPIQYADYAV